jgi:hypothetical protein
LITYPVMVLVRAQIVRVIGARRDGKMLFRQKPLDRRRYARFDLETDEWPGAAVPTDWVETPDGWQLEPSPNGHAVLRCRRIEFDPPQTGIVIGNTALPEGTIVQESHPDTPWSKGSQIDRRQVDLYEIAMPPNGAGGLYANRARIILAHAFDVTKMPGQKLWAQKLRASQ